MSTFSLNSNIATLKTGRQLDRVSTSLAKNFERLSTGMRINRASDDAAGLSVSLTLSTNARLFSAAVRNIGDGVSLLNIMDGALESQTNILQRLKELAQQSANGTFSDQQRGALNSEFKALVAEFGRVSASTSFNGIKPLQSLHVGGTESFDLQIGIDGSENSRLKVSASDTGSFSGTIDLDRLAPDPADWLMLILDGPVSNEQIFETFEYVHSLKVTDSVGDEVNLLLTPIAYWNGAIHFSVFSQIKSDGMYDIANGFLSLDLDETSGRLANEQPTLFESLTIFTTPSDGSLQAEFTVDLGALIFKDSNGTENIGSALDFTGVETSSRATRALEHITSRLNELNSIRGESGATMSRLEVASNVLRNSEVVYRQAAARIVDVDIASETSELVRNQILQQAAVSVHSLASQQPQLLLKLLDI